MSLMFPTIYGLGIRGLGNDTKIGGSGLIMAILGGAVLTAVQGQISDALQNINLAFYVPFICFVIIALYAVIERKLKKENSHAETAPLFPVTENGPSFKVASRP
jgi:FHS family L-fucose permease-like MFS transporter